MKGREVEKEIRMMNTCARKPKWKRWGAWVVKDFDPSERFSEKHDIPPKRWQKHAFYNYTKKATTINYMFNTYEHTLFFTLTCSFSLPTPCALGITFKHLSLFSSSMLYVNFVLFVCLYYLYWTCQMVMSFVYKYYRLYVTLFYIVVNHSCTFTTWL